MRYPLYFSAVVFLSLAHRHNLGCDHKTVSSDSGVKEYLRNNMTRPTPPQPSVFLLVDSRWSSFGRPFPSKSFSSFAVSAFSLAPLNWSSVCSAGCWVVSTTPCRRECHRSWWCARKKYPSSLHETFAKRRFDTITITTKRS